MKRILCGFLALFTLLGTVGCSENTEGNETMASTTETTVFPVEERYTILSKEEYMDRTTAGFLGQLVGFFSGYEFVYWGDGRARVAMPDSWFEMCNGPYANPNPHKKHSDKLLKNDETGLWESWMDDDYSIDILNQYILRDMYAKYGTVTSKVITDGWVKYNVYDMGGGHRSVGAYGLMSKYKYLPRFAGSWEFGNRYSYCYEPCIENETLGMVTAGMPNTAAELSDIFAGVTSDQDPVVWTKFLVAMYSMAYFESDIPTLIRKAQQVIPSDTFTYKVIDGCFSLKEKYPDDWRAAVREAEEIFTLFHDRMINDKTLEPNVNNSFVLLALLYGEGDYTETCKIVSLAGYDGDSTAAICMGLMGVLGGMKTLPEEANELIWQNGDGVVVNLAYPNTDSGYWMCMLNLPERMKITDIVELYRQNFESILFENGGYIEDGNYYIPKQTLGTVDSVYYEDFENGGLATYTTFGGTVETVGEAFEGDHTVKISGSESGASGAYTTIDGLTVGEQYRVVCYVNTTARTTAQLFVRETGKEGVVATMYDQANYSRRTFVFTATAASMEFGIQIPTASNPYKAITLDHITITRIAETPAAKSVTIDSAPTDGKYTGKIRFTVEGKAEKEVLLKLTFANPSGKTIQAAVKVNGDDFNVAPIYKTGSEVFANAADAVYTPILLREDSNTVTLDVGSASLCIANAEVVTVRDLW